MTSFTSSLLRTAGVISTPESIREDSDLEDERFSPVPLGLPLLAKESAKTGSKPGRPHIQGSWTRDSKERHPGRVQHSKLKADPGVWAPGASIAQNIQGTHSSQSLVRKDQAAVGRMKKACNRTCSNVPDPLRPVHSMDWGSVAYESSLASFTKELLTLVSTQKSCPGADCEYTHFSYNLVGL